MTHEEVKRTGRIDMPVRAKQVVPPHAAGKRRVTHRQDLIHGFGHRASAPIRRMRGLKRRDDTAHWRRSAGGLETDAAGAPKVAAASSRPTGGGLHVRPHPPSRGPALKSARRVEIRHRAEPGLLRRRHPAVLHRQQRPDHRLAAGIRMAIELEQAAPPAAASRCSDASSATPPKTCGQTTCRGRSRRQRPGGCQ